MTFYFSSNDVLSNSLDKTSNTQQRGVVFFFLQLVNKKQGNYIVSFAIIIKDTLE